MSLSPLNTLSTTYLQSILGTTPRQTSGATSANSSSITQPDGGQLSPFAQMLTLLQQLQQSNPSQFQQITQQIATNLQSAAQTAQQNGNTSASNQLNQLATDFTNASKSGQLPNISDLAQAVAGHRAHHHHGHAHAAASNSNDSSSQTQNPMAIIDSILAGAGISTN